MYKNSYMDLESNLTGKEVKSESGSDVFNLKSVSLPSLQNDILAIGVSQQFLMFSNKKSEVFRWIYNDDESLKQAYNIPMQEKERGVFSKFFCEPKGNHTIFRHNKNMFYFNIRSNRIKELFKLKEFTVESIGWDEKSTNEFNTNVNIIF